MKPTVVIVGGTGVFGARLARRLIADRRTRVLVAGRDAKRLAAFWCEHGSEALQLDRDGELLSVLRAVSPFAIIDAAGPFQHYGDDPHRLARAAISVGAHYLDLSDDAAFTAGISALQAVAIEAGVAVLSGVSSVPAISAAAVRALSTGLDDIELIDTVILPGNRAPRGLSVVRAIVSQVGRPLSLWRDGRRAEVPAWSGLERADLEVDGQRLLGARSASFIGAPDLALFPAHFRARSVLFRAGLELPIMHLGLYLLSWLVRLNIMPSLESLARPLLFVASRLEPFGSDRGGMRVAVTGVDGEGLRSRRTWTLTAEAGSGPEIPAIPAFVMIGRLLDGVVPTGARACLDEPSLDEIEVVLPRPEMQVVRTACPAPVLYERLLGNDFRRLPPPLRRLHAVVDQCVHVGEACIETGRHPLAQLVRVLMRFPVATPKTPVEVTMTRAGNGERWTRRFGSSRFVSVLREHDGECRERFGLLEFTVGLRADEHGIEMPVTQGRFLGIRLPAMLVPESRTREFVDDQRRACFDVEVLLPRIGRIIRYRGFLLPKAD